MCCGMFLDGFICQIVMGKDSWGDTETFGEALFKYSAVLAQMSLRLRLAVIINEDHTFGTKANDRPTGGPKVQVPLLPLSSLDHPGGKFVSHNVDTRPPSHHQTANKTLADAIKTATDGRHKSHGETRRKTHKPKTAVE